MEDACIQLEGDNAENFAKCCCTTWHITMWGINDIAVSWWTSNLHKYVEKNGIFQKLCYNRGPDDATYQYEHLRATLTVGEEISLHYICLACGNNFEVIIVGIIGMVRLHWAFKHFASSSSPRGWSLLILCTIFTKFWNINMIKGHEKRH